MSKPHVWRSTKFPGLWASCLATKYRDGKVPIPVGRVLRPCLGQSGAVGYGKTPAEAMAAASGLRYALYKGTLHVGSARS